MKVRIVTDVVVHEPSKLLDKACLAHFRDTGEWVVPESIGEAVLLLHGDRDSAPLDCGFEIVEQQAEEVTDKQEGHDAFAKLVAAWRGDRDFALEEKRFQNMVDAVNSLADQSILDDLIHDLVSHDGSDINNQGLEGQLAYLIEAVGWEEAEREVGALIQSHPSDDS